MLSAVGTGKTLEKAIEDGLSKLNVNIEDVEIKVINDASLFKKAKVELEVIEKTTKESHISDVKHEKTAKPKPQSKPEKQKENDVKAVKTDEVVTTEKTENIELSEEEQEIIRLQNEINELKGGEDTAVKNDSRIDIVKEVEKFFNGLIYAYNVNAQTEIEEKSNHISVKILGDNLGILIGYRGEALEAISYITNNYLYNKFGRTKKVSLDIEGYRSKREETLKTMADSLVDKVIKNQRSFKLEPMNSYERKVIHSHLQNKEHISTHSEGKEPHRYLVIDFVA